MGLHYLICGGYNFIATKVPRVYGTIYNTGNRPVFAKGPFTFTRRMCQQKIKRLLDSFKPDVLIAVHPIVTDILGGMKERGYISKDQKVISIITDYLSHYAYVRKHPFVDAYFVGGEVTRQDLLRRGVLKEKIYSYGIPIKREFYTPIKPKENKNFTLLVMGGSLGSKNMDKVIRQLISIEEPIKIIIVCGKDQELRERMEGYRNNSGNKEIVVFGFTNRVSELMDEADLLISKPGGASVTEALLRKVPMIIPYLIGGQEKENLDYLVSQKAAIWVGNVKTIAGIVEELIQNPEKLNGMKTNMDSISAHFSIEKTMETLNSI